MFYIDHELLQKLPEEVQKLIMAEGTPLKEGEMPPMKEGAMPMLGEPMPTADKPAGEKPDILPPDEVKKSLLPDEEAMSKISDENKSPRPTRYGEEGEFEDVMKEDGGINELPESKKNAIDDFGKASERGMALIEAMNKKKKAGPMKKKKIEKDEDEEEVIGKSDVR